MFRLVVVFRYAVASWYVRESRRPALCFALGFGLAALLLWLGSAAVPALARFALWGAGFLVDFGTPLTMGRLNVRFPLNSAHLQERFGNFTVLGEGVLGVIKSLRDFVGAPGAGVVATLALVLGFALWWMYFETLDGAPIPRAR